MISVSPGDVIAGKFRVTHELGRGGMGVVVAADHLHLPQQVAIKFLKKDADAVTVARFRREAQTVVQLRSEHVCRVLDVGSLPSGEPFIVMELLHGQDFAERVAHEGPLAVVDAVDAVLQACEAVAEAHVRGVVHRDLKPNNLFWARRVDGSGVVKVLDFGISKSKPNDDVASQSLTESGAMLGSPRFMSPEQLVSTRNVDHRTDVWSLGVVLRVLLTGRAAFQGDTAAELFVAILQEDLAPMTVERPDLPPAIDAIVRRCLQKTADDRFQSVGELALALAPFASETWRPMAERVVRVLTGAGWTVPRPSTLMDGAAAPSAVPSWSTASPGVHAGYGVGYTLSTDDDARGRAAGGGMSAGGWSPSGPSPAVGTSGYPTSSSQGGPVAAPLATTDAVSGAQTGAETRGGGSSRSLLLGLAVGVGSTLVIGAVAIGLALPDRGEPKRTESKKKERVNEEEEEKEKETPAPVAPSTACPFLKCDRTVKAPTGVPLDPVALLPAVEKTAKTFEPSVELTNITVGGLVGGMFEPDAGGSMTFLFRYPKPGGRFASISIGVTPEMLFVRRDRDFGMTPVGAPRCPLPKATEVGFAHGLSRTADTTAIWGGSMGRVWLLSQADKQGVTVDDACARGALF